eukprot:TRINITY_DN34873_c0_g1_i3.p2 TRINITY_DN34873_c0_g1~~TRINITY_DN34873_c0_g1_i3.p2  ORF type:complete len:382 (+),score=124.11 TRINITY_DN34873_c0_g1_i3:70-1146(+)
MAAPQHLLGCWGAQGGEAFSVAARKDGRGVAVVLLQGGRRCPDFDHCRAIPGADGRSLAMRMSRRRGAERADYELALSGDGSALEGLLTPRGGRPQAVRLPRCPEPAAPPPKRRKGPQPGAQEGVGGRSTQSSAAPPAGSSGEGAGSAPGTQSTLGRSPPPAGLAQVAAADSASEDAEPGSCVAPRSTQQPAAPRSSQPSQQQRLPQSGRQPPQTPQKQLQRIRAGASPAQPATAPPRKLKREGAERRLRACAAGAEWPPLQADPAERAEACAGFLRALAAGAALAEVPRRGTREGAAPQTTAAALRGLFEQPLPRRGQDHEWLAQSTCLLALSAEAGEADALWGIFDSALAPAAADG